MRSQAEQTLCEGVVRDASYFCVAGDPFYEVSCLRDETCRLSLFPSGRTGCIGGPSGPLSSLFSSGEKNLVAFGPCGLTVGSARGKTYLSSCWASTVESAIEEVHDDFFRRHKQRISLRLQHYLK